MGSEVIDVFLGALVQYVCIDREAMVSYRRLSQSIQDKPYHKQLTTQHIILTGSLYEGMPSEVCSDQEVMVVDNTYPVVVSEPPGDSKQYQSGFVVAHGNPDQPAYLRLKVTDM